MPSSLTHLRLAVDLSKQLPLLKPYPFAVGSIAPDSGVIRPDKSYDPPKAVTHFKVPRLERFVLGDWIFYQHYLLNQSSDLSSPEYSFLQGYFCHLLTDNLWAFLIGKNFAKPKWRLVDAHFLQTQTGFGLPPTQRFFIPAPIQIFLPGSLIWDKVKAVFGEVALMSSVNTLPPDDLPDAKNQVDDFVNCAQNVFYRVFCALQTGLKPPPDQISVLTYFAEFLR